MRHLQVSVVSDEVGYLHESGVNSDMRRKMCVGDPLIHTLTQAFSLEPIRLRLCETVSEDDNSLKA